MRADRLLSELMLLQAHGKMSSAELARELEVSPRTIFRDVTALCTAGVPVYTDRGPGGGIALLDSYRTTLTGLTEEEARALFMLSIPEALIELGVGEKLKTAMLKLVVALPEGQRMMVAQTQQRVLVDTSAWNSREAAGQHLEAIHQAVWNNKMLKITYQGKFDAQVEVELEPLGLVSKMNRWYLVGRMDGYLRVIGVNSIVEARTADRDFEREEDFNLDNAWREWVKDNEKRRPEYKVIIRISPELTRMLNYYLGEPVKYSLHEEKTDARSGWNTVTISYDNFFQARESILGFGGAAEVVEPEALRLSVIDFAQQVLSVYH